MARSPERREDLIGEATAMPARGEVHWKGEAEACVIGFRPTGAASVYFGEQPVLHFDPAGKLRRLFHQDQQILGVGGTLQVRRRLGEGARMSGELCPLSPPEADALRKMLEPRLRGLLEAIVSGDAVWGRTTVDAAELDRRIARLAEQTEGGLRIGSV